MAQDEPKVVGVRVDRRREAPVLGIGSPAPPISWRTETDRPGWTQAAYEIEVAAEDGRRESSGRVDTDASLFRPWPASPLASRQRVDVRVRVWGSDGGESAWSDPLTVEAGLLDPSDWVARFVTPADPGDPSVQEPSPYLRTRFEIDGPVDRARLHVTALGVYEVELNGTVVGDHVLAPGWTSYDHRVRVETFDVTDLLHDGTNVLGAVLADGWYRGQLGFQPARCNFGDRLALLAQLEVTDGDGTRVVAATGPDGWETATGPILTSGIYEGEVHDARLEDPAWSTADGERDGWGPVEVVARDLATVVARIGPPVRRIEEVRPKEITVSPAGRTIVDFGQNLVGRLRIEVDGPAGTEITLRHAEVLQDGELCTDLLRTATAVDRYLLRGGGPERWEPRFTFHGFRYAEVTGWPGELRLDDLVAVVCHSDMVRTGWFACSDPMVDQLHENAVWGMRGNFLDVPTDCPQRDERLGWTGDIQVFTPSASYLYDCDGFLADWLADLAADQEDSGVVPIVVPNTRRTFDFGAMPFAGWSDAAVIVPDVLHERFGDAVVLRDQYGSMRRHAEYLVEAAGDDRLWTGVFQLGDWLDPAAPEDSPGAGRTDPELAANAYVYRVLCRMAAAADVLGEDRDADRYRSIAAEVRDAFADEYLSPSGRPVSDSQTACALVLEFGLVDGARRERAAQRLAKLLKNGGHHIGTGFLGTPVICDALTRSGHVADAYALLLQRECPSFLYPITVGATTIWERWDGLKPDGTLNGTSMNSFNHYALGAVVDWLHRTVGGLAPAEPGYRRLEIAPVPGGGLTHATSRLDTPYGRAEVAWRIDGAELVVDALVPPNCTATVRLPAAGYDPEDVGAGRHTRRCPWSAGS